MAKSGIANVVGREEEVSSQYRHRHRHQHQHQHQHHWLCEMSDKSTTNSKWSSTRDIVAVSRHIYISTQLHI